MIGGSIKEELRPTIRIVLIGTTSVLKLKDIIKEAMNA